MRLILTTLVAFFGLFQFGNAQFYGYQAVYPQLTGQQLLDSVSLNYRPATTLTYNDARDTMYYTIYKVNDSVECVYTGHKKFMPLNPTPSASSYMAAGGSADGINAEHSYPQSMGAASGNAQANMHHLFPTRAGANSARSNHPYAEIPDNQTNTWFYLNTAPTTMPTTNINAYSEYKTNTSFEPRESHKGNAARAMMYFYTMYRTEAIAANPTFFNLQKSTLCAWHMQDPVDELEWNRTFVIARYQSGKTNPFVLDCTLAKRMYCQTEITSTCTPNPVQELPAQGLNTFANFPNPIREQTSFLIGLDRSAQVRLVVYNQLGQPIAELVNAYLPAGDQRLEWQVGELAAGVYFAHLQVGTESVVRQLIKQ
jgi:hypothetical protein